MKKSAPMITLFSRPPSPPRKGSASIAVSLLAHAAGCIWLFVGLSHVPHFEGKSTLQHFTVRVLDVPLTAPATPPPPTASAAAHSLSPATSRPLPSATNTAAPAPAAPSESGSASMPTPAPQLKPLVHQSQTLIQPDAPPNVLLLHKTPIPTVFIWNPSSSPIKPLIEAPQQKSIVAQLRPKADPPNREVNLADIKMSSTPFTSPLHMIPPSTTTPVVVRGPDPVQQMPQTLTQTIPEAAPVRVMSLSDLQAQPGPVAVPLANATASPNSSQSLSSGHSQTSAEPGRGSADNGHANSADTGHSVAANKQTGAGQGQNPAVATQGSAGASQNPGTPGKNAGNPAQTAGSPAAKAPVGTGKATTGNGLVVEAAPGPATPSNPGSGLDNLGSVTRITYPKDGQFGVVVVGSAIAAKYPETVDLWNGRLVYTVYLHVGAGKNWILQYALPQANEASTRPDAPWPYDIVRPRFDPDDFTSDALMVHGFVNADGHFERLALVFPTEFSKSKLLLSSLQQWEFRPARQNGQVASVEVLLIIPEETE